MKISRTLKAGLASLALLGGGALFSSGCTFPGRSVYSDEHYNWKTRAEFQEIYSKEYAENKKPAILPSSKSKQAKPTSAAPTPRNKIKRIKILPQTPIFSTEEHRQETSTESEATRTGREAIQETPQIAEYPNFRFRNEMGTIRRHARRVGVDERLMLAIRESENGRAGRQFGIMPNPRYNNDRGYTENGEFHAYPEDNDLSRQAAWAAHTIRRNMERFQRDNEGHDNFIDYLSNRYAPRGVDNDPDNLNRNWARNVRARYRAHGGE